MRKKRRTEQERKEIEAAKHAQKLRKIALKAERARWRRDMATKGVGIVANLLDKVNPFRS